MKPQARQFLTPVVQRQRGVALVTILIVVALASLLATALITSHKLSITHAASLLEQGQVTSHALSGEAVARALLREEIVQNKMACYTKNGGSGKNIWKWKMRKFLCGLRIFRVYLI